MKSYSWEWYRAIEAEEAKWYRERKEYLIEFKIMEKIKETADKILASRIEPVKPVSELDPVIKQLADRILKKIYLINP
jgi:hypothetical protein